MTKAEALRYLREQIERYPGGPYCGKCDREITGDVVLIQNRAPGRAWMVPLPTYHPECAPPHHETPLRPIAPR